VARPSTLEEYRRRILIAQQVIDEHLDEPIDVGALAREADFSLHHFHRIFRGQMGESVMQHVRRLRLERAARRIRTSDMRLLDAALEAGYESHEAFTRAFVERFGVAPSQFRDLPSERIVQWQPMLARRPAVGVFVATYPRVRVAFMRHRGGYAGIDALWQALRLWASQNATGGKLYGLCPDDPEVTDESLLRFDACVEIDTPPLANDIEVGTAEIPGGRYAVGVHVGSYATLSETYLDVIGRWFPESGYRLTADAVVEHYLNSGATRVEDLRTEVRVRIAH